MTGLVLWEGLSRLDPSVRVVVIATGIGGGSKNDKTGPMVQTWVLRTDMEPHAAVKAGADDPVCGDCPLRAGQGCYVRVDQAPLSVYRAWLRGAYARWDGVTPLGDAVRLGAYGDPAAAPVGVWERATVGARVVTGYTHQWRRLRSVRWRRLVMASVESVRDAMLARARGWRTFRVATGQDAYAAGREVECPSDTVGLTCIQCGSCDGQRRRLTGSVWIRAHGSRAGLIAVQEVA
jgi:hypothetical protein